MQSIHSESHHQQSPPNQQQQQIPPLSLSLPHQTAQQQLAGVAELVYDAHSPQSTGSPEPPPGILTDAEVKLWELAMAIHSVQTKFNRPMMSSSMTNGTNGLNGTASASGGPGNSGVGSGGLNSSATTHQQLLLAEPIQEILQKMVEVDEIAALVETMIPRQAIEDLDNTHHPGHVLKERIESVALENAFLNGKIEALSTFRNMLGDALADSFPELASLRSTSSSTTAAAVGATIMSQDHAIAIKQEES